MERVTGIGGVFCRSKDPDQPARWYEENLGITRAPGTYEESPWWQEAGSTVWGPMLADSAHFGEDGSMWAVAFRVTNLVAMVAQLQGAGIDVAVDPNSYPNGRFAAMADAEGNPIQLWEPQGHEAHRPAPRSSPP